MNSAIEVHGLSKHYHLGRLKHEVILQTLWRRITGMGPVDGATTDFWALRDVSFNVAHGEVVGIIGRNGAGKSTLLKVVARISHPTSGTVKMNGRAAALLEVGTGFHPDLSGRENIYLNGSILGMTRREVTAKMDQIIEFAGFSKFIDTPIKRYSSGMKLRLGFAVAAHLDPEILIVDEVLAVGDVAFQKKCLSAMSDLQSGGRTVLFVSHNMQAVESLCSRVIWIDEGRVRADGDPREVIQQYLASYMNREEDLMGLAAIERPGTGAVRFTGMEFLTAERRPKPVVLCGESLVVRLHYQVHSRVRDPHFGLVLSTELGNIVTDLSTWNTGLGIPELCEGRGSIDFEIDSLTLMPGRYLLSLWSRSIGGLHYDELENFTELEVLPGDYYGAGRGLSQRCGLTFFPGRWRLVEPNPTAPQGAVVLGGQRGVPATTSVSARGSADEFSSVPAGLASPADPSRK